MKASGMVSGNGKEYCLCTIVPCAKVSMASCDGGGEQSAAYSRANNAVVNGVHTCRKSKMVLWITWLSISLCSATSTLPTEAPRRQEFGRESLHNDHFSNRFIMGRMCHDVSFVS